MTASSIETEDEGGQPDPVPGTDGLLGADETEPSSHPVEPRQPPDDGPTLDVIFTVLKNQRRRWVLAFLNDHDDRVTLSDLSEFIAGKENDKPISQLSSQERKRAYVGLYQCHLPMMDDAGIIEYNKDRGWIELTEWSTVLDRYLEKPTDPQRPWHVYYLGVAGVTAVAAILCLVVPSLPAVGVVLIQAIGLGLLAVVHGWEAGLLDWIDSDSPLTTPTEST